MADLKAKVSGFVAEMDAKIGGLRTHGPCSRYEIEGHRGALSLTWDDGFTEGIACSLDSEGYAALYQARGWGSGSGACGVAMCRLAEGRA